MTYSFKRALGIALALYVATFIIGIIAGIASGTDMSTMNTIPDSFWYVGMVSAAILSALFTLWYLRGGNITASPKSGFLFGLTTAVLSFLLDFILFSLGNAGGANVDLWLYYGDIRFWIIIVIVLLASSMVGHAKERKAGQS